MYFQNIIALFISAWLVKSKYRYIIITIAAVNQHLVGEAVSMAVIRLSF
jgi:hypothetical protein